MNPLAFGAVFGLSVFGGLSIDRLNRDIAKDLGNDLTGPKKSIVVRARIGLESLGGVLPAVTVVARDCQAKALPFHVDTSRSHYGRIRHLRVSLERLELNGLPIRSLKADIPNVRFDLAYCLSQHHFSVSSSGYGPVTVVLAFRDLQAYAAARFQQIKELEIRAEDGAIAIRGSVEFSGMRLPFVLKGVPTVERGVRLTLSQITVEVNHKLLSPALASLYTGKFTSLLDVDKDLGANGAIQFSAFRVTTDALVGTGTAAVPSPLSSSSTAKH